MPLQTLCPTHSAALLQVSHTTLPRKPSLPSWLSSSQPDTTEEKVMHYEISCQNRASRQDCYRHRRSARASVKKSHLVLRSQQENPQWLVFSSGLFAEM